jgi:hypothetical protein
MIEQPNELDFSKLEEGKYYKVRKYTDTNEYEYEFFLGKKLTIRLVILNLKNNFR